MIFAVFLNLEDSLKLLLPPFCLSEVTLKASECARFKPALFLERTLRSPAEVERLEEVLKNKVFERKK
jgi:hypothetical protein